MGFPGPGPAPGGGRGGQRFHYSHTDSAMQNPLAQDPDDVPKRDVGGVDAAGADGPEQGGMLGEVETGVPVSEDDGKDGGA